MATSDDDDGVGTNVQPAAKARLRVALDTLLTPPATPPPHGLPMSEPDFDSGGAQSDSPPRVPLRHKMSSTRDKGFQSLLRDNVNTRREDHRPVSSNASSFTRPTRPSVNANAPPRSNRPTVPLYQPRRGTPSNRTSLTRPIVSLPMPWADADSLKVNLKSLPDAWGTLDVYKNLSPFGQLDRIEVYESRGGQFKNGWVVFRPPPRNGGWLDNGLMVIDQDGNRHQIKCETDYHKRSRGTNESSPERTSTFSAVPLSQIDAGMMQSKEEMRILFTSKPTLEAPVTVLAKPDRKELEIRFGVQAPGTTIVRLFKLEVGFSQIKNVCDLSGSDGDRALLISVDQPPILYRQSNAIEETHRQGVLVWNERNTWFRQTAIDERPDKSSQETTQLQKNGVMLDLGRWLTYRLAFSNSEADQAAFQTIGRVLVDHNVTFTSMSKAVFTTGHARDLWSWHEDPGSTPSISLDTSSLNELHSMGSPLAQLDFSVRYHLEVALSQGVISECNIQHSSDFLTRLASLDPVKASRLLQKVAEGSEHFYNPSDIFRLHGQVSVRQKKIPKYCAMVPSAVVTPSTIYFTAPAMETSNRVIREYRQFGDRFLRVKFTDERYKGKIHTNEDGTMNQVLTRVYRTMKNGIQIGDRHYDFLAFGNAQFREHGAYFFASTGAVTAQAIRDWMGNFTKIQVVAKYASRIGQCFSTTRALSIGVKIDPIPDIERNGFVFTDGVGKISPFLAQMIADEYSLPMTDYPSVFQFRLGGCKGVLVVDPMLSGRTVQIRPSQEKFPATYQGLEICRISQFSTSNLNAQIILVLNTLGVKDHAFLKKMHDAMAELAAAMTNERKASEQLNRNVDFSQSTLILADMIEDGFMSASEPFLISCLRLWHCWMLKNLKEKARIPIEEGAFVFGCVDETATLQGHFYDVHGPDCARPVPASLPEIFLQVLDTGADRKGMYKVVTGVCVLARNPSLHPGDVRVVQAVDVEALHHLKNCVVLPQTGDRDLGNMCAGGDLDGDDYLVMWDPDLIPMEWNEAPMDYTGPPPVVSKGPVTVDDITSFYVKHIKNDSVAPISVAHRCWADHSPYGVKDEKCLELAHLASTAVDYAKTGVPAVMPSRLYLKSRPHWAKTRDSQKTYHSRKVLGQLYDMVQRKDFYAAWELPFDTRILDAFELSDEILQNASDVKLQYDEQVRRIMAQHGIKSEFEVWTTFMLEYSSTVNDYKFSETISETVTVLKQSHQDLCYEKAGTSAKERDWTKMGPFIAAMYVATAREVSNALEANNEMKVVGGQQQRSRESSYENMPFMSFPWIFAKELGLIAIGRSPTSATVTHSMTLPSRKPAPKPLLPGFDFVPPPLPEVNFAGGIIHEGDLLEVHAKESVPSYFADHSAGEDIEPATMTPLFPTTTATAGTNIHPSVQSLELAGTEMWRGFVDPRDREAGDMSIMATPNGQPGTEIPPAVQLDSNSASTVEQRVKIGSVPAGDADEEAMRLRGVTPPNASTLRPVTETQQRTQSHLVPVEADDDENEADDEMEEVIIAPSSQPSALDVLQTLMEGRRG